MEEKNIKEIGDALELLSEANNAMIDAIVRAVADSDKKEISYKVMVDIREGVSEVRTIKANADGDLSIFFNNSENDYFLIEDLSADELYNICLGLTKTE